MRDLKRYDLSFRAFMAFFAMSPDKAFVKVASKSQDLSERLAFLPELRGNGKARPRLTRLKTTSKVSSKRLKKTLKDFESNRFPNRFSSFLFFFSPRMRRSSPAARRFRL